MALNSRKGYKMETVTNTTNTNETSVVQTLAVNNEELFLTLNSNTYELSATPTNIKLSFNDTPKGREILANDKVIGTLNKKVTIVKDLTFDKQLLTLLNDMLETYSIELEAGVNIKEQGAQHDIIYHAKEKLKGLEKNLLENFYQSYDIELNRYLSTFADDKKEEAKGTFKSGLVIRNIISKLYLEVHDVSKTLHKSSTAKITKNIAILEKYFVTLGLINQANRANMEFSHISKLVEYSAYIPKNRIRKLRDLKVEDFKSTFDGIIFEARVLFDLEKLIGNSETKLPTNFKNPIVYKGDTIDFDKTKTIVCYKALNDIKALNTEAVTFLS